VALAGAASSNRAPDSGLAPPTAWAQRSSLQLTPNIFEVLNSIDAARFWMRPHVLFVNLVTSLRAESTERQPVLVDMPT